MPRRTLCLLLACMLCSFIVYAPELYHAASSVLFASSAAPHPLHISLCAEDPASEQAFASAFSSYIRSNPSVHLCISRTDRARLFTQSALQADVVIYPADLSPAPDYFLHSPAGESSPAFLFCSGGGKPLLCCAAVKGASQEEALAFLHALCGSGF